MEHPINLTSMKQDKKSNTALAETAEYEEPAYPYGLEISLEDESLKKLGITDLPEAGQAVAIHANATVSRASSSDTRNGGKKLSLSLQIVELGIDLKEEKETSEELYG